MILVDHLSKSYNAETLALDDVSFKVEQGVAFGLLGPNGAGKTTALRIIMGLLQPTAGEATILGYSVTREPLKIKSLLGLVSASAGLYQWLTPREVLHFFAIGFGLDEATAQSRIRELSEIMDLTRFLDRRCATLSTGQGQRVNLARALIHDPPVVLLDEPTRGLDVVGSKVVFDYVDFLRQQKKAIIVSTHQLDEAERLCDRFGLLHRGQLKYSGSLAELRAATGESSLVDMFLRFLQDEPTKAHDAAGASS